MENFIYGAVIGALLIVAVLFSAKPKKRNPSHYVKKNLLTKTEYAFWKKLQEALTPHGYLICPKVRMEDFLGITNAKGKEYSRFRGYIKSRHVDFIICDGDLHILAGLELDDSSHDKKEAKETDEFKDGVFETIGIPLYRVKVSEKQYDKRIAEILKDLEDKT